MSAQTIRRYIERLTHIGKRIPAGGRVRSRLHRWALRQLQDFVAYKVADAGVATPFADPAYTRKACSECCQIGSRMPRWFTCNCGRRARSDVKAASKHALLGQRALSPSVDVTWPCVEEARHVGL